MFCGEQCLGALHLQRMWRTGVSVVRPCMEYACVVWNPHTAKDCALFDAVQNQAAR